MSYLNRKDNLIFQNLQLTASRYLCNCHFLLPKRLILIGFYLLLIIDLWGILLQKIVLHDQELTYSLVGPISNSTIEPYSRVIFQKVNDILLATMRSFGVFGELAHGGLCGGGNRAVCFSGIGKNEISVNGKKIAGSAQRRTKNSLLLQGSILLGPGHRKLPLLMPDRDYARRKEISQILNSRTITVSEVLNTVPTFDELCQCLINKFFKKMDINGQKTSLENNEKKEVAWLIKNKYGTKNWNYARRIKNHDQ